MPSRDLIISCMAVPTLPTGPGQRWEEPPQLIEWAGTAKPGHHPGWSSEADKLREAPWRKGRLLPNLINRFRRYLGFGFDDVRRIAAVGFSAGANSGLRELLRNPEDRERIDFVASIDGLHPNRAITPSGGPDGQVASWASEMAPIAEYALLAAKGRRGAVYTASSVPAPSSRHYATREALWLLQRWLISRLPASDLVAPRVPTPFPATDRSAYVDAADYPRPDAITGVAEYVAPLYPGGDKQAHRLQARVVVPDVFRSFLIPRWSPSTARPVSDPETDSEPVGTFPSSAPRELGAPGWVPPAISAASAATLALVR